MQKQRVLVVGGGFAGLQLVRNIDTRYFEVTLIDKVNYHQFQPLFYQVATAQLETASISFPFRKTLQKKKNISIRLAEVKRIISEENKIETSVGEFDYDILVLATGCTTHFYGNENIKKHALTLKSATEAIEVRNTILTHFEKALTCPPHEIESYLTIVIAGGGPTGVELAGSFAEIRNFIMKKDFPEIDINKFKIVLLEGGNSTLGSMSAKAQKFSQKYLNDLGVEVRTNTLVQDYDGEVVLLSDGQKIQSRNLLWAAGITTNLIAGLSKAVMERGQRIATNRYNKALNYENIYVLGDLAHMKTEKFPEAHPQVANVAINQARLLAKNLKSEILGKQQKKYEYKDLGSMATVGRNKALVDLPAYQFKGFFAWIVWMFLHLMLILSVRNKLIIFINWAGNYITRDTSLRLILGKAKDKQ